MLVADGLHLPDRGMRKGWYSSRRHEKKPGGAAKADLGQSEP